jgi:hypothetical protein
MMACPLEADGPLDTKSLPPSALLWTCGFPNVQECSRNSSRAAQEKMNKLKKKNNFRDAPVMSGTSFLSYLRPVAESNFGFRLFIPLHVIFAIELF